MGADFLLVGIPKCDLTPTRRAELEAMVKATPPENVPQGLLERVCCSDEDHDGACYEEAQNMVLMSLDTLQDAQNNGCFRGMTSYVLPEWPYPMWFSGGMSWGDDPNDCYGDLEAICQWDAVWEKLAEYAREDQAA